MRVRTPLAVLFVLLLPLGVVWLSRVANPGFVAKQRWDVTEATEHAARAVADGSDPGAVLTAIAQRRRVRIRVVDGGMVTFDADHEAQRGLVRLFYGGERPTLRSWDDAQPPLSERPEVRTALSGVRHAECGAVSEVLYVCTEVRPVGGAVVHVQKSTLAAVRSLYESRFEIAALTVDLLAIGLFVGLWLSWRIVRPVEELRRQVLERTETASTTAIVTGTNDELGDLGAAFNVLLARLEEKRRANEAFAADLAHELKNPTAALRAAIDALEGDVSDPARKKRILAILRDGTHRLEVAVGQYLDLARAEAGLAGTPREPVAVHELVGRLVERFRSDPRYGRTVFACSAEPFVLDGVAERLEAAIGNLLANAAAYAGDGGTVTVVVRPSWVSVADTGPGIPPEDLPHLFDRFFSRRPGGTGLGLPLARAVVEAHGGTLTAEPHELSGAVFVARFAAVGRSAAG